MEHLSNNAEKDSLKNRTNETKDYKQDTFQCGEIFMWVKK